MYNGGKLFYNVKAILLIQQTRDSVHGLFVHGLHQTEYLSLDI